jgi:hypothetical protein
LAFLAFLIALIFAIIAKNEYHANNDDDNNNNEEEEEQELQAEVAVTSRAMAFAALWTAVLACLMGLFGTVILGFQNPVGHYYTCCSSGVHRTTPLGLGSFIGSLIMFANLTLVCSVLFGEFEIRDYPREGEDGQSAYNNTAVERTSMVFSIMCMFLTVIYAGFAALTFAFSHAIIEENNADAREESLTLSGKGKSINPIFSSGYIGERFDVRPSGFVAPSQSEIT